MKIALKEAHQAFREDEVPIGAVLISEGTVLARAHNMPLSLNDPTAHAEILVLREASLRKSNYRLPNTTLYVTVEPCSMCAGAIVLARLKRVVYGVQDVKSGAHSSLFNLLNDPRLNHRLEVIPGIISQNVRV